MPENSAGYSIAPTPTIVPWPDISRGTEWLVPMVPGLVRLMRGAGEVVGGELAVASPPDDVLVGGPEPGEVDVLGLLDGRPRRGARLPFVSGQVDGEAQVDVLGVTTAGLPSTSAKALFISGCVHSALTTRVADEVGEADLAAASPTQVVVDDDPVVGQRAWPERPARWSRSARSGRTPCWRPRARRRRGAGPGPAARSPSRRTCRAWRRACRSACRRRASQRACRRRPVDGLVGGLVVGGLVGGGLRCRRCRLRGRRLAVGRRRLRRAGAAALRSAGWPSAGPRSRWPRSPRPAPACWAPRRPARGAGRPPPRLPRPGGPAPGHRHSACPPPSWGCSRRRTRATPRRRCPGRRGSARTFPRRATRSVRTRWAHSASTRSAVASSRVGNPADERSHVTARSGRAGHDRPRTGGKRPATGPRPARAGRPPAGVHSRRGRPAPDPGDALRSRRDAP